MKPLKLIALLGTLAMTGAHADTSGTVSLSNFRYDLVDLDLNDGVAPSLTWNLDPQSGYSYAYVDAGVPGEWALKQDSAVGAHPSDPVEASLQFDRGSSVAASKGTFEDGFSTQLAINAATRAPSNEDALRFWSQVSTGWVPFVLSANTAVTFRTDFLVAGDLSSPRAPDTGSFVGSAYLSIQQDGSSDDARGSAYYSVASGSASEYAQTLEVTFSNLSTATTHNTVYVDVIGTAFNATSPVPEPAAWMMLIGGMGLLGASRMRANRKG